MHPGIIRQEAADSRTWTMRIGSCESTKTWTGFLEELFGIWDPLQNNKWNYSRSYMRYMRWLYRKEKVSNPGGDCPEYYAPMRRSKTWICWCSSRNKVGSENHRYLQRILYDAGDPSPSMNVRVKNVNRFLQEQTRTWQPTNSVPFWMRWPNCRLVIWERNWEDGIFDHQNHSYQGFCNLFWILQEYYKSNIRQEIRLFDLEREWLGSAVGSSRNIFEHLGFYLQTKHAEGPIRCSRSYTSSIRKILIRIRDMYD